MTVPVNHSQLVPGSTGKDTKGNECNSSKNSVWTPGVGEGQCMFPFSHLVRLCKADGAPRVLRIKAQACQRMALHGFLRVWDPLGYTPEEKEHVWEELLSNISLLMLIRTETNDRLLVSCTKPAWRRETIRCFNSTAAHQK